MKHDFEFPIETPKDFYNDTPEEKIQDLKFIVVCQWIIIAVLAFTLIYYTTH